jgi:heat-inducible transcriptional repressor
MTVFITDSGRVEQRVLDVASPLDEVFLGELRSKLNTAIVGLGLQDAAAQLTTFADAFPASRRPHVTAITSALVDQVLANRQDKLLMAGTANLARTEQDFSGSIYPVLEAIEEQVTLLKLFSEMEADHSGVSVSIGRENDGFGLGETSALAETSVLTSGYTTTGGSLAKLGVLGPMRMDYSNNMAAVRAVARYLSRLLGETP